MAKNPRPRTDAPFIVKDSFPPVVQGCEDCGQAFCLDCRSHYCCEPCPCEKSHRCECECRGYDRRMTFAD